MITIYDNCWDKGETNCANCMIGKDKACMLPLEMDDHYNNDMKAVARENVYSLVTRGRAPYTSGYFGRI